MTNDDLVLALADDELFMGHHWSTWISVAPFLEEDLAVCSIGQDELGHAHALYSLLTDEVDRLALHREPAGYRSAWLCETAQPEWADTLARHLLYDVAETLRWEVFRDGDDAELAGLAAGALREEAYHRRHAEMMVGRLVTSTDEARAVMTTALDAQVAGAVDLFALQPDLVAEFRSRVDLVVQPGGVELTWPDSPRSGGGRDGVRSPGFDAVFARMRRVVAIDPDAAW